MHIKLDHQNSWISNQLCGMDVMDVTLVYDAWSLLPHLLKFRLPDDWIFESVTRDQELDLLQTSFALHLQVGTHLASLDGLATGDISFP